MLYFVFLSNKSKAHFKKKKIPPHEHLYKPQYASHTPQHNVAYNNSSTTKPFTVRT